MKKEPLTGDLLLENARLRAKVETLSSENETLQAETLRMAQRIAYLERMLYGAKSDRLAKQAIDQPTLFDGLFDEAMDERDKAIAGTAARPNTSTPAWKSVPRC